MTTGIDGREAEGEAGRTTEVEDTAGVERTDEGRTAMEDTAGTEEMDGGTIAVGMDRDMEGGIVEAAKEEGEEAGEGGLVVRLDGIATVDAGTELQQQQSSHTGFTSEGMYCCAYLLDRTPPPPS
jgi:hypothetical protein